MLQRLQILVTEEQRHRLKTEARRRGGSVASLVREAIDARFGRPGLEDRLEALEKIRAMSGTFLSPDELNRLAETERERPGADVDRW